MLNSRPYTLNCSALHYSALIHATKILLISLYYCTLKSLNHMLILHRKTSSSTTNFWSTMTQFSNSISSLVWIQSQSQIYVMIDGQSVSLSWNKAPIWDLRPDLYYCLTFTGCRYIYTARTTQKTRHVVTSRWFHWCADCCLATSYEHSSYCCLRVSRGVYRAVIWQWSCIVGRHLS
jgi:hypothetical protein